MTKHIAIVVTLLAITSTLYAADSRTATKFLRAYVDTLCAEKSGDHAKALETITPFATIDGREMHATAADATYGQYGDASIQASWALVTNTWAEPRMRFAVGKRERKEAVRQLRQCFGSNIADGPNNRQSQIDRGASLMVWFLTHDIDPVAQPRGYTPTSSNRQ